MADQAALVTLGTIGAPHGVKGEVRVKSGTADPLSIGSYGPVTLPDGRRLKIKSVRPGGEVVIVKLEGINDRTAAEALKHMTLSVPRDRLPPTDDDDEFYHADLIGLRCETADGTLVGHVTAVHDFGAGDVLDIRPAEKGPQLSLAFTKASVPSVDIAGGKLIVVLPQVVEVRGE
jgi:16S rRNA processing protein RimM